LEVFSQILKAVEHMQSRQIVHRDIHPGNIIVDKLDKEEDIFSEDLSPRAEGTPILVDFNCARSFAG
jgi:serine/threonine protein kinase